MQWGGYNYIVSTIYVYSKTLKYKLGPFILTAPHPTLTITTQKPLGAFGESVGVGVSEASMYKSVLKSISVSRGKCVASHELPTNTQHALVQWLIFNLWITSYIY